MAISSATKKLQEGRTNGESVIVVVKTFGRKEKINLFYCRQACVEGAREKGKAPQVAQARNMSIGERRHCCVTF